MKKKFSLILAAALLLSLPGSVRASDDVWTSAKSEKYGTKAGAMLGRGVLNVGTSFVDILVHTVEGTQNGPAFIGTMSGLGSGLGCTALRLTSGALDVLTFWVPNYNGFPLSPSYSNCLEGTSMEAKPAQAGPDYDAERAKLEAASRDAQNAIAAEREAFEKAKKQAMDDLEKEKARLAAEQKKNAEKLKYIK